MSERFARAIANRRTAQTPTPKPGGVPSRARPAPRIAPLAGWYVEGPTAPHAHRVTVVLPHLNTLEQLKLAVRMWRLQTVKPYICVVDTGSPWEICQELETVLRATDLEVHFIRGHGYRHSSEPVTAALDLSHTRCQTEYLFHTHTDVFPYRRDFLAMLLAKCSHKQPVVGWQMSPRNSKMGAATHEEWKECVSHTATMLHMPTVHRARLTWAMEGYLARRPTERGNTRGWPDTESGFHLGMKEAGIKPLLLGPEPNFQIHDLVADGIAYGVHARSYTGLKMAHTGPLWDRAAKYMAEAEKAARARLAAWESPTSCSKRGDRVGETQCATCGGKVTLNVFACKDPTIGQCTVGKKAPGVTGCCQNCNKREMPL